MFLDEIEKVMPQIKEMTKGSIELDQLLKTQLMTYASKINFSQVNPDHFKEWENHLYFLFQEKGMKDYEWKIVVPKWADSVHFGMLVGEVPGHRVFLVSRYIDMVYKLPEWLREKIGANKDPLEIKLDLSTMKLKGKDVSKVEEKYKQFLIKHKDGTLEVNKEQYFELLAQMIEDGIKPFEEKPIPEDLIVKRKCDIILKDYQEKAFKTLQKNGMGFICWPPSGGKTFITIYLHAYYKGPHLVAVPQRTLQEQWIEREELYTDLKVNMETDVESMQNSDVTILTYQSAIKHGHKIKWTSVTVDEGHHLPANEFSKLSGLDRVITLGLSATPHREDGREKYLWALYGEGIGIDWESMKKLGVIKNPDLHVWIVKNEKGRMEKLDELLSQDKRTVIFSDEIEIGKVVSKKYGIPFIYGDSKDRMNTMRNSRTFVMSRVGDEGISLPDLERVIEISFLKGSRRQELQRFTRILHSKNEKVGEGHIIFDPEQYTLYHKRLFGVMDRGFKIIIHREGVADHVVSHSIGQVLQDHGVKVSEPKLRLKRVTPDRKFTHSSQKETKSQTIELDESKYPLLKFEGFKKIMKSITKAQRNLLLFLIDPTNQNQWFTLKTLALSLGYSNEQSLVTHKVIQPLESKEYVIKRDGKYKQGFSEMLN